MTDAEIIRGIADAFVEATLDRLLAEEPPRKCERPAPDAPPANAEDKKATEG